MIKNFVWRKIVVLQNFSVTKVVVWQKLYSVTKSGVSLSSPISSDTCGHYDKDMVGDTDSQGPI